MLRTFGALSLLALTAATAPAQANGYGYGGDHGAYWQRANEDPWYGVYVGVVGGGSWGEIEASDPAVNGGTSFPITSTFDVDGGFGGGTVGAQAQWGWLLFGLEGDITFGGADGSARVVGADPFGIDPASSVTYDVDAELRSVSTIRLRAGYAWDRAVLYVTGGFAFGDLEVKASADYADFIGTISGGAKDNSLLTGFTIGAGGEVLVTPHISLKAEYLFVDLEDETFGRTNSLTGASFDNTVEFQTHLFRGGVNYRF